MQIIKKKVSSLENVTQTTNHTLSILENEVAKITLTLENETNRNIKIIAEGHLDLSRKLDEAIKLSNEVKAKQELQDIYINRHNNQLQAL